jgi:hypothetical protein
MVSSGAVAIALWATPVVYKDQRLAPHGEAATDAVLPNLALSNDLMFDHAMRNSASQKNYGDDRDIQ